MSFNLYPLFMRLEDIAKNGDVTKHFQQLKRLRNADPEYLNDYKWEALQKLLGHAYANVPFYRKRFDSQGIHPGDIKSFEDFSRIPPLTREDAKNNCKDLISSVHKRSDIKSGYTSGSSGTPMIYCYDTRAYSAGRAAVLTGWEMAGKKLSDKMITVWGCQNVVDKEWAKPGSRIKAILYRDKRIPGYSLSEESKIRRALDIMRSRKGGYVFGYANALYTLASYAQENNIELGTTFKGILTTAENLFPYQKRVIEEVFGPVYDGYGCNEILGIAFQCREQKGYHIVEPNVIFETEELYDGIKEVVVTDLWNYAWPLIRYKPNDLVSGEITSGCRCGCTWNTFERIDGRTTDIITAPDGTIIYYIIWLAGSIVLDIHPYIKQFQWVKVADDKLILRLLAREKLEKSMIEHIKADLKHYIKNHMEVDVEVVDRFELGPSGKHKVIVDTTRSNEKKKGCAA